MSSKALISCTMNIDLYLLNCHPLNPSILQTMSSINSTYLKISRIIFCFKTISMKKLRLHIHEFKRSNLVLWPISWSKLLFFFKKLLCFFCSLFDFFIPFITCLHVSPWRLINYVNFLICEFHASLCTEILSVSYRNLTNKSLLNQLSFSRKRILRP